MRRAAPLPVQTGTREFCSASGRPRSQDPRITVIEVTPTAGYYWDNKHGNVVAGAKMLVGAALGKTLDDSIEGRLDVQATA